MEFNNVKARYPNVPVLAMSGSMNEAMICKYLDFMEIDNCILVHTYPDRPNIFYRVIPIICQKVGDAVTKYIEMSVYFHTFFT